MRNSRFLCCCKITTFRPAKRPWIAPLLTPVIQNSNISLSFNLARTIRRSRNSSPRGILHRWPRGSSLPKKFASPNEAGILRPKNTNHKKISHYIFFPRFHQNWTIEQSCKVRNAKFCISRETRWLGRKFCRDAMSSCNETRDYFIATLVLSLTSVPCNPDLRNGRAVNPPCIPARHSTDV